MKFKIYNGSQQNLSILKPLIEDFLTYAKKYMKFNQTPKIIFKSDERNSRRMLGKTAFYDPKSSTIVLFVDGRHPKDVMRSL